MNAREFLKRYKYDDRLVKGNYYPAAPVEAEPGDTIGVVLMNLGGPDKLEDVEPFLYNLFMDPAIIDMPVGGTLRHWISKLISTTRSKRVGRYYEEIGGGSPINRLTRQQAELLEKDLNWRFGEPAGVTFRVYIAMRYWHPTSEEAAEQMGADGVKEVVLLPLYPQYSKTTTGSSLLYWWELEQSGEIPQWPTSYVFEYAAHPKFLQALNDRIEEELAKFPEAVRDRVHLLFSAHGTPLVEMKKRRDPYCCLIHSTVEQVMALRNNDRPFHVAFQSKVGPAEWLTPSTPDKLKELAEAGHRAVLVVPVAFVTDHIETLFELGIEIREEAEEFGIEHYEVTTGLNDHPKFIEALAEVAAAQVLLPAEDAFEGVDGRLVSWKERPRYRGEERCTRCHQCEHIIEAIRWDAASVKA